MVANRERGQLVLIAAILVATAVLGAVVLLNAVHSSPDVKAQTDAQSLSGAERMVSDIRHDLEALFFATSTADGEDQQPFAQNVTIFERNVTEYNEQLGEFVSRERAAVAAVEYDVSESQNGSFVAGEKIPNLDSSEALIEDADSVPYLRLALSEDDGTTVELYNTSSSDYKSGTPGRTITVNDTLATYETGSRSGTCGDVESAGTADGATVELRRGGGQIQDADGDFCTVTFDDLDTYYVRINTTDGSAADGSFAVSGGGSSASTGVSGLEIVENGVVVNPAFDISYRDPSVSYTADFWLFGRENS